MFDAFLVSFKWMFVKHLDFTLLRYNKCLFSPRLLEWRRDNTAAQLLAGSSYFLSIRPLVENQPRSKYHTENAQSVDNLAKAELISEPVSVAVGWNTEKSSTVKRNKSSYRFFVGQQLFSDPEEVFTKLSQPFNEALLQFFRGRERERKKEIS